MNTETREFRQKVGSRIKAERERKELTQKDFAKLVGLSNQTYNNLENGLGSLKLEHLYQIAEKCGCDIGYLLGECEERTYVATDICKETGLSEEAVSILRKQSALTDDRSRVIDFLIKDSDEFGGLMSNVIGFLIESNRIEGYRKNRWFEPLSEIIIDCNNRLDREWAFGRSYITVEMDEDSRNEIIKYLKNEGYSAEEIEGIENETDDFFSAYRDRMSEEEIEKAVLHNVFTKYMDKYLFNVKDGNDD